MIPSAHSRSLSFKEEGRLGTYIDLNSTAPMNNGKLRPVFPVGDDYGLKPTDDRRILRSCRDVQRSMGRLANFEKCSVSVSQSTRFAHFDVLLYTGNMGARSGHRLQPDFAFRTY